MFRVASYALTAIHNLPETVNCPCSEIGTPLRKDKTGTRNPNIRQMLLAQLMKFPPNDPSYAQ